MRFELEYWKTDRNGTKYYLDWNCPRCGGAGEADKWFMTGKTCYACGGTGKRAKAKVEKVYTPEYEAKLEARRAAKLENVKSSVYLELPERIKMAEECKRNQLKYEGLTEDGNGFIHYGNTYKHLDTFRMAGARWCQVMKAYIAPKEIKLDGVNIIPVTADAICYPDGRIDTEKAWDFAQNLK